MTAKLTHYIAALCLGALYCFGFAPFELWPALVCSMAGLFWILRAGIIHPMLAAFLFGVGKYGLGASWVYVSIHVYGHAPVPLAMFLVMLFVLFVAAVFVLPLGKFYRHQSGVSPISRVLAFASAWWLLDWFLTWFLTGFPWLFPAHGLLDSPVQGLIPVLGALGTGWLVALSAAALVECVQNRADTKQAWQMGVVGLTPWLLGWLLSVVAWVSPQTTHEVALVQGNLEQARKWLPAERVPNVQKHLQLSAQHWDADLIIWPEAAITLFPDQAEPFLEEISLRGRNTATSVITGIPGYERQGDDYLFYNMALGLGEAQGRFRKHHLVPFGEYVPLESLLRGLIGFFDLPMSSTVPGRRDQANIRTPLGEIAMAICYEVAYADSMRLHAQSAAVLATISNDTWFGESYGPHQHMQIAQARALENGRWMLRATNNGITAIVDHRGVITEQLPQFSSGVLRGEFQVMQGITPYSRFGHTPIFVLVMLLVVMRGMRRFLTER